MPHIPKLGNPPPIGTPLDSPEWLAWKTEIAAWYAGVISICTAGGMGVAAIMESKDAAELHQAA